MSWTGHCRRTSLENSGIGVRQLLPARQGLGWQNPEEFTGKEGHAQGKGRAGAQAPPIITGEL